MAGVSVVVESVHDFNALIQSGVRKLAPSVEQERSLSVSDNNSMNYYVVNSC